MSDYRLSRDAEQDIAEIGRYTQRTWGLRQRRIYLRNLARRMKMLASRPQIGVARDELEVGLRSFPVGPHVIFYSEANVASRLSAYCT
jgi:toxin ParE1/3/4